MYIVIQMFGNSKEKVKYKSYNLLYYITSYIYITCCIIMSKLIEYRMRSFFNNAMI